MILRKEVPMSSMKIKIHKQGEPFPIYTFLSPKKEKEIYDIYNSSFLIVGATCETAQQSMVDAKDALRKTPLFKHKAKYHINRALELYKKNGARTVLRNELQTQVLDGLYGCL